VNIKMMCFLSLIFIWFAASSCGGGTTQPGIPTVDYTHNLSGYLDLYCVSCHNSGNMMGGYAVDSYGALFENGSDNTPNVILGQAAAGSLLYSILGPDEPIAAHDFNQTNGVGDTKVKIREWISGGGKE